MKKMSTSVMLGAGMALAFGLACAMEEEKPATDTAICIDPNTEVRVDDDKCDDDDNGGGFLWIYYGTTYNAPGVGSSVRGTPYYKTPTGSYISRVPSKGGFGGHMGTTGG